MTSEAERPNPYVGLRPFDRGDSLYFFGRRGQVAELLQQLHNTRFLAVVGSSGCGKSSLIRAGLIPALQGGFLVEDRDRWLVAKMKPGGGPIQNLARSLCGMEGGEPKPEEVAELTAAIEENHSEAVAEYLKPRLGSDSNLLLLLDQFEEIFAFRGESQEEPLAQLGASERRDLSSRQNEAADFIDLVLLLAEQRDLPVYVVLTMRSDFLGDCDVFFGLPEAMNLSRYLVPRLTRGQLREAIEGPPLLMGQRLAPRLVDALLNELGERSDQLPILQHALLRSWDCWQSQGGEGAIDLAHYEAAGTLREALPRHANEALRVEDEAVTARIFQCLTDTDPNNRRVRRAASIGELATVAGVEQRVVESILQRFNEDGRNFLLISPGSEAGDASVEITHESLIRQWDRLARWVDEESGSRDQFRELVDRARGDRALLRDPDLQLALNWRDAAQPTEAWARRYSRDEGDLEAALGYLERSRLAREEEASRRRRNRNLVVAATLAVFVALSGLALWAMDNAARARDTARVAIAGEWIERDPTTAAMLLLEVERPEQTGYAAPRMRELLDHPVASHVFRDHEGTVRLAVFSPDGSRIVTASTDGMARVWSADGSSPTVVLRGHKDWVVAVAVSPDGTRIVTGSPDGTARVWNADGSGEPLVLRHEAGVASVAFSPDGSRIATGSDDETAWLWTLDGTSEPTILRAHDGPVEIVAFSPDGSRLLTASEDATVRVWSVDDPSSLSVLLSGHEGSITQASFSPDGSRILTGAADGGVHVWSADGSGEPVVLGRGSGIASIFTADFSPDGTQVVATAFNRYYARVWDADGGEPIRLLHDRGPRGLGNPIAAAFSPDGTRVVTGSGNGLVQVWNADGSGEPTVLRGHKGFVFAAVFSPDGSRFVTTSDDATARVWSTRPASEPIVLSGHEDWVAAVAFSPDGSRLVTASDDGTVRVWPAGGEGEPVVLEGHEGRVGTAAFDPDGARIVTTSDDETARVWPADGSGEPVVLEGHESAVLAAAQSPDGTRVATASDDNTVRVWSADGSGESVVLEGHAGPVVAVAFSPDGTRIVTGSDDATARVWSADGSGEPIVLAGHEERVGTVAFSSDGSRIVTASGDWTARLWNADGSGEPLVFQHDGWVGSAAFSHDGTRIVTASDDWRARVWNVDGSGEPIVLRHTAQVGSAVFSPDGAWILTSSGGGMAHVWNADGSGEPLLLKGHESRVTTAAFSPDGALIATASEDGTARLWAYKAERLQRAIASLTRGCLDVRFRESYLDESPAQARRRLQRCERDHGR
jgi:WD40 repeat protein/energy-coupling factor transporter ATP-binding protein EcfA2